MQEEKILMDILDAREARALRQKELLKEFKTSLVSFTLNIPGQVKDSPLYREIHREGERLLVEKLEKIGVAILHKERRYKVTGPEFFLLADKDALELKKLAMEIEEENPLGRIFDMDVFDKDHNQVSRSSLKRGPRRCLICNRPAKECIREGNHNLEELLKRIEEISKKYFKVSKREEI